MNVFFISDWDFTELWPRVARSLVNEESIDKVDALVVGRVWYEKLLKTNHAFSKTWLLQDYVESVDGLVFDMDRLKELEKAYGCPTIWRYMWADRSWVNESYENSVKLLVAAFDFFEKIYGETRPDLIMTSGFASMPHLVGFAVAEKMKIPVLRPIHFRLGGEGYLPSYSPWGDDKWVDQYIEGHVEPAATSVSNAEKFIETFRSKPKPPSYMPLVLSFRKKFDVGLVFRFFRYVYRYYINGAYANDHSKKNPFAKLWNTLVPMIRRRYLLSSDTWDDFPEKHNYVYYPLHFQPEASTMVAAPFYLNELSIIENLAKSVPAGVRVLVKEQPVMLGRRDVEVYRQIKKICNVVLVHPLTNNFEVIKNAKLIFTITGTAGIEGLLFKKPIITLGDVFYNKCELVRNIGDVAPTLWYKVVEEMLTDYEHDEAKLIKFVAAMMDNTTEMAFFEPLGNLERICSEENVERLKDFILKELDGTSTSV